MKTLFQIEQQYNMYVYCIYVEFIINYNEKTFLTYVLYIFFTYLLNKAEHVYKKKTDNFAAYFLYKNKGFFDFEACICSIA